MKPQIALPVLAAAALLFTTQSGISGRHTWLEVESQYTGDGWFEYRLGSLPSPLFTSVHIPAFSIESTNFVQMGTSPANWYFNGYHGWNAEESYTNWQTIPYQAVFRARSAATNYTEGRVVLLVSMRYYGAYATPGTYSLDIVGYWVAPALVPSLEMPTNSQPASLYTSQTFDDVVIHDLIRNSGNVSGIVYSFSDDATFALEASSNMTNWQRITYLYSLPGTNTWTTNTNLGQWGNFYRLAYMGPGHWDLTNLPPLSGPMTLNAKMAQAAPSNPVRLSVTAGRNDMIAHIQTVPGRAYEVRVSDAGKTIWTSKVTAQSDKTTVSLPLSLLPTSGLISANELR